LSQGEIGFIGFARVGGFTTDAKTKSNCYSRSTFKRTNAHILLRTSRLCWAFFFVVNGLSMEMAAMTDGEGRFEFDVRLPIGNTAGGPGPSRRGGIHGGGGNG
jgi:hypothetical protein